MAKYKIIPSSRTIVQSPISIGHKAEKGVEAIEFDLTAWVETYGSGTLTVIMRRWGDAAPYPIALEIDENNKATWTLSDTDTAKAGMAYAQLSYIVGETVVKKSDIYTFRVMDSLTGEGEPPEAYESWLEHLTHLAAEAMAEVLDIEGVATDKTLTVDGGIADAKATGEALAEKVDAADYNELSARVGANTIALAEKADQSTTYTKTEVDALIDEVEVETDTTLAIPGAPADAAETGRQIGLLKADLGEVIVHSNNLINPTDYTDNAYVETDTGNLHSNSGYFATGFIEIEPGVTYKSNKGRNLAWYKQDKTYDSGVSGTTIQSGITAPSTAKFIRFTINKTTDGISTPDGLYFAKVDEYNPEAKPHINGSSVLVDTDTLDNVLASQSELNSEIIRKTSLILDTNNLINPTDYTNNVYVETNTGNLHNASGYFATNYIEVDGGTTYRANHGRNWAWYKEDKTYDSGGDGTAIQTGITAPSTAKFIRFTINKTTDGISTPDGLYFAKVDEYEPIPVFNGKSKYNQYQPWCYGLKINWIGDSIVDGPDFDEYVCSALNLTKLTTDGVDGGINGSTIALKSDGTNSRNALCLRYANMPDDADIIAVSAGTNDFEYAWCPIGTIESTDNNTLYGALKTLCEGLITKYPHAVIFFTTPIKRMQPFVEGNGGEYTANYVDTTPFSKNKYGKTLGDYADIIKEVCGLYSIPVLDMYRESLLNPHIVAQQNCFAKEQDSYHETSFYFYTHPNAIGQKIMARRVAGWLTQIGYLID